MAKISLIGAGNIGGELASLIASKSLGDIVLVDVIDGLAKGKALDLGQSGAVRNPLVVPFLVEGPYPKLKTVM